MLSTYVTFYNLVRFADYKQLEIVTNRVPFYIKILLDFFRIGAY